MMAASHEGRECRWAGPGEHTERGDDSGQAELRVCCDLPPLGLDCRMRLGGDVLFSGYPDGHLNRKGRLHR